MDEKEKPVEPQNNKKLKKREVLKILVKPKEMDLKAMEERKRQEEERQKAISDRFDHLSSRLEVLESQQGQMDEKASSLEVSTQEAQGKAAAAESSSQEAESKATTAIEIAQEAHSKAIAAEENAKQTADKFLEAETSFQEVRHQSEAVETSAWEASQKAANAESAAKQAQEAAVQAQSLAKQALDQIREKESKPLALENEGGHGVENVGKEEKVEPTIDPKEEKEMPKEKKETVQPVATEESPMALPPNYKGQSANKKKSRRLFSAPLFKEALKSNRAGLSVVSAGNALIMIIIVGILSTLHINSSAKALKNLFSNADTESTVRSGAISFYSAFSTSAEAEESYIAGDKMAQAVVEEAIDLVNDSSTNSQLSTLKLTYDIAYLGASGTAEAKAQTAKSMAVSLANSTIDNDSSKTEQEKEAAKSMIDAYFDVYGATKVSGQSKTNQQILIEVLPGVMSKAVASEYSLSDETKAKVQTVFEDAFSTCFASSTSAPEAETKAIACQDASFRLIPLLSSGDEGAFAQEVSDKLYTVYTENTVGADGKIDVDASKKAYLADSTLMRNALGGEVQSYILTSLESFAYYSELPTFTVEYQTSDLGYPITYVGTGEFGDDGTEIKKAIEVKAYNPDVYVKIDGGMGPKANLAEKMHKDLLTGEDYTEEEIVEAKEKAKESLVPLQEALSQFLTEFHTRDENNQNVYFDGQNVLTAPIVERSTSLVASSAEKTIIDQYNETNKTHITSIDQITAENSSMTGAEMMDAVKGYASSGIASFQTHLKEYTSQGYDQTSATLIATVKASQGVIDQLPGAVGDSLTEMGQMNTYGIMVGAVSFGIACLLIPMVYTILTANSLVAAKVESGSLAFTLSTPTRRASFIFTEMVYLLFTEVVMGLSLFAGTIVAREIGIALGSTDLVESLPIADIALYALGNFGVTIAISGINFFASCWFNKGSQAIGAGGGITIAFFIFSILGLFGTKAIPGTVRISAMSFFNYITVDSCFDAMAVMNADYVTYTWKLCITLVIAILTYGAGFLRFTKKDLPL